MTLDQEAGGLDENGKQRKRQDNKNSTHSGGEGDIRYKVEEEEEDKEL